MKRSLLFSILLCLILLTSCAVDENTDNSRNSALNYSNISANSNDKISFSQFYTGFTCIGENNTEFEKITNGTILICTEKDFAVFCSKYCTTAGSLNIDFDSKCLIAVASIYGSRANENSSFEITAVNILDGKILDVEIDTSAPVYAINSNGHNHLFVNIVSVDRSKIDVDKNGDCLRWAD